MKTKRRATAEERRLKWRFRGAVAFWSAKLDDINRLRTGRHQAPQSAADRAAERWRLKGGDNDKIPAASECHSLPAGKGNHEQ